MARFNNIAVRDTEYYTPKHFRKADQPIEDEWSALIAAEVARRAAAAALESVPASEPAPKAPKAAPAPKADAGWWDEWFAQPWVKATQCKAGSSIVKMHCEGSHGSELRAAGWQYSRKGMPIGGGKKAAGYWWAYKDELKAKERGERYLARKAERQAN